MLDLMRENEENKRQLVLSLLCGGITIIAVCALVAIAAFLPLPAAARVGVLLLALATGAAGVGAAAALDVLRLFGGRKFVVTPGLVELGVLEESENAALGERMVGLDRILLVGSTLVTAVRKGYLAAGGIEERVSVHPTLDAAKEALAQELMPGDTVLFLNDLPDIYN